MTTLKRTWWQGKQVVLSQARRGPTPFVRLHDSAVFHKVSVVAIWWHALDQDWYTVLRAVHPDHTLRPEIARWHIMTQCGHTWFWGSSNAAPRYGQHWTFDPPSDVEEVRPCMRCFR